MTTTSPTAIGERSPIRLSVSQTPHSGSSPIPRVGSSRIQRGELTRIKRIGAAIPIAGEAMIPSVGPRPVIPVATSERSRRLIG
jgi:hypothetical protein